MIDYNPKYEEIFNPHNIDDDCNKIAKDIAVEGEQIKELLDAGLIKEGLVMYLQLMKSMAKHFIEDEHYCFFDDMYSPEYALQAIFTEIIKHDIGEENQRLLDIGHAEIMDSECYQEYGYPSYI